MQPKTNTAFRKLRNGIQKRNSETDLRKRYSQEQKSGTDFRNRYFQERISGMEKERILNGCCAGPCKPHPFS